MDDSASDSRGRIAVLTLTLALAAVVSTWFVGHLPWVLDGFALPTDAAPAGSAAEGLGGVRIAIPLIAGQLTWLVAFTAVGATVAGLTPLTFPWLPRSLAVVVAGLMIIATTLVLTMAARGAIGGYATDAFAGDDRVLDGLVVGVFAVAGLTGFLACLAAAQPGLLPLPIAVLLGQLPVWLAGLGWGAEGLWEAAVLVLLTAALVLSVRRSPWWALLWPLALAVLWTAVPLRIATGLLGDRLRPGSNADSQLGDIVDSAVDVFQASYFDAPQTWWPGAVAVGAGVCWLVFQRLRSRLDR